MFVGREEELSKLEGLYGSGSFQMAVVYGRRRVGKTALINEFCKGKRALVYGARPAIRQPGIDFNRAVGSFFNLPASLGGSSTWADALNYVAEQARSERFVLVFDEFPYAAERNEALPSIFQVAIDKIFKETAAFIILCGSNQGFMEALQLSTQKACFSASHGAHRHASWV